MRGAREPQSLRRYGRNGMWCCRCGEDAADTARSMEAAAAVCAAVAAQVVVAASLAPRRCSRLPLLVDTPSKAWSCGEAAECAAARTRRRRRKEE